MKYLKKVSILFLFVLLLSSISIYSTSAKPPRASETEIHSVNITDAYYIGCDIYASITLTVKTNVNTENYYLKILLINPIDEETPIIFHIITSQETVNIELIFYNYATVSGEYIVEATIISDSNGWFAVTDVLVINPPSSGSEGDPYIGVSVY